MILVHWHTNVQTAWHLVEQRWAFTIESEPCLYNVSNIKLLKVSLCNLFPCLEYGWSFDHYSFFNFNATTCIQCDLVYKMKLCKIKLF